MRVCASCKKTPTILLISSFTIVHSHHVTISDERKDQEKTTSPRSRQQQLRILLFSSQLASSIINFPSWWDHNSLLRSLSLKVNSIPLQSHSQPEMHSALFDTFRRFDDLRCEYEEARVEWLAKADIGLLATAQAAEAIDEALSVKLVRRKTLFICILSITVQKNVDEMLSRFSAEMEATHQDLNRNIDTRRAQAANILLRARIQMEVVRLMEMKILLPKELWMPESAILLQVHIYVDTDLLLWHGLQARRNLTQIAKWRWYQWLTSPSEGFVADLVTRLLSLSSAYELNFCYLGFLCEACNVKFTRIMPQARESNIIRCNYFDAWGYHRQVFLASCTLWIIMAFRFSSILLKICCCPENYLVWVSIWNLMDSDNPARIFLAFVGWLSIYQSNRHTR